MAFVRTVTRLSNRRLRALAAMSSGERDGSVGVEFVDAIEANESKLESASDSVSEVMGFQ